MFEVLGVSGSPRKEGNTELLLEAALEPFAKEGHRVERFYLSQKRVAPCIACEACAEDGICAFDDDLQGFLERLAACDALIVGSPVYQRNVTAQLLALFDRLHCIMHRRPFRDRICFGGAIAVGGSPNAQGVTLNVLHSMFLSLGLCCVPAVLNGVSVVAREKGEVLRQPKSLTDARVLGENVLRVLERTRIEGQR